MKGPQTRTFIILLEKKVQRKNKWAPVASSSFLHQDYSKDKKVQNRFRSSSPVGCLRLSRMVSASPTHNWEALERFSIEPLPLPQPPASQPPRADVVWGEQVAPVGGRSGVPMNWRNSRISTNFFSCKCCGKCLPWHHCFCPCYFHFSCSLLHAKPGFIAERTTEVENGWCWMFCCFNFSTLPFRVLNWLLFLGLPGESGISLSSARLRSIKSPTSLCIWLLWSYLISSLTLILLFSWHSTF